MERALSTGLARGTPLTGIAFVALWVAAFAIVAGRPESASDAEIVAHYADEANRGKAVVFFDLVVVASLCFLGFLTVLCGRLARGGGPARSYSTLTFAAGLASTTLWLVAGVFWLAVAYTANETPEFRVDPNADRLVGEMAYLFWVTGMYTAIPLVLGASLLALRASVLPRWVGWLGLLVALSLLGALAGAPFFLFLGWVLLVSVVLLVRRPTAEGAR